MGRKKTTTNPWQTVLHLVGLDDAMDEHVERLAVPGGWLYRATLYPESGELIVSTTFVRDSDAPHTRHCRMGNRGCSVLHVGPKRLKCRPVVVPGEV